MPFARLPFAIVVGVLCLLPAARAVAQSTCDSTESCLVPHGEPGCDDAACCQTVCTLDPFCCESWDATCVSYADASCVGLCGANASGPCFSSHPNPSCNDAECCGPVCLIDPYCCSGSWDGGCVFLAGFTCSTGGGECGDPQAGDCFESNGTAACDDASCCESVCALDPRCCDVVWDAVCVALAEAACIGGCEVATPDGAVLETEDCGAESNDPCDGGVAEPLDGLPTIAGTYRTGYDTDAFEIDLALLDLDGDGLVRLRIGVFSAGSAILTVGPADCAAAPTIASDIPSCVDRIVEDCVAAGPTWIRLESSVKTSLCDATSYVITLDCRDTCDDPCGTGGDCLEPRTDAGCGDPECCAAVCEIDPTCCDWEWDAACAVQAAETCGGPPPVNDACVDAIDAASGLTPFRHLLSTPDGPAAWCGPGGDAGGDVWFRHRVTCGGTLYIGTCNSADFDTVVEVFRGDCASGLEPIGCRDDSAGCGAGSSLVQIDDAACGETLLVRVLAADGPGGNGSLVVDCFGPTCPCPADLDGDGRVGGSDLGILFSSWGPCGKACDADLDGNGAVGGSDLGMLFSAWGDC